MHFSITIPGEPRGKARPRFFRTKKGGIGKYDDAKSASYENLVKMYAREQVSAPDTESAFSISVWAYFAPPKSMKKSLLELVRRRILRCLKKPDADNIAKIACDAMNGIVYRDDAQVTDLMVYKRYSETPSVVIVVNSVSQEL